MSVVNSVPSPSTKTAKALLYNKLKPQPLPKLHIAKKPFDELTFEDFTLEGYQPAPLLRFAVAV